MNLSPAQEQLLEELNVTDPNKGLTPEQVSARRFLEDDDNFNTVPPPIDCPAWLCILLPCISKVPSMKIFQQIKPDDAEVKRNGKWIRYDASSLVKGDIIRVEEGDIVPADCVVLQIVSDGDEILVDSRYVTGDDKPQSIRLNDNNDNNTTTTSTLALEEKCKLYWGGHVVQGSAIAVVTAIGKNVAVAQLIRQGKFPPKAGESSFAKNTTAATATTLSEDEEGGISLISRQEQSDNDII